MQMQAVVPFCILSGNGRVRIGAGDQFLVEAKVAVRKAKRDDQGHGVLCLAGSVGTVDLRA
jgi:hypothetical protein